ncbi:tripartite tricarboxylate transporter permease [Propylenella binzhouense]|uniref:Tripartite tricarboxylate transporter permease n=1 Tax=Propylenella binzhouense TaxID=2555902 RepID=A0A964T1V7_9HYPH|nr:tripartite tricarboxylate transporter permease [Propylenella binzhouense]MYZ46858.1 tripartite tricarboxylate transporter permease [Propylenella binzhouense]
MDILSHIALGLQVAGSPGNLFYCLIGVLLGTIIGVLPGIGPTATVAMLLPITFSLSPEAALIMLAGIYYGSAYGGSTTAILINLPGEASASVTTLDGYQMALKGRPGAALSVAAVGSFVAGCVATLLIAMFAVPLTRIALDFGPAEYFSLIILGLVSSVTLAHGSIAKALAMILLGLLLGTVGTDIYAGVPRFTFGFYELAEGLSIVPLAVGLFGVAEILRNLGLPMGNDVDAIKVTSLFPNRSEARASVKPILRGTVIGSLLGVLPGGGALLSSFASYTIEKKLSKHPEMFGNGAIEGVAGPESANNAGAQTSFIPMLTLGIPSNGVMALMIGALMIQGIQPGPNVVNTNPELFWGLIVSMWIGNLMLVVLNLPLVGLWVKMLSVPYKVLFPSIMVFSAIGAYTVSFNSFDVYAITAFGLGGYILIRLGCEPVPLLLGFVLGPLLEENLRRATIMSQGNLSIFVNSPISAGLIVAAAIMLAVVALPYFSRKREEVFVED